MTITKRVKNGKNFYIITYEDGRRHVFPTITELFDYLLYEFEGLRQDSKLKYGKVMVLRTPRLEAPLRRYAKRWVECNFEDILALQEEIDRETQRREEYE